MRSATFYEIELKALLSREKFNELWYSLPEKMKLINEETIHTTRYRPNDIRLRHSSKTIELVCKEGDVTQLSRKETRIPLQSMEQLDAFREVLKSLSFSPDPPWTKKTGVPAFS